ncbi:VanZ family protein [Bacillus aerolatus]|uniref:VanZ family protein n=1 Tax=Bacillus aerolatus TaxID=2653354 RepID=A0A6I1FM37_9BACI|nr:VanZ family protein [Bacillus aerolatus]KAB7707371.1 VanZ family protein [Bacillus aerolatus]
MKKNPFLVSVLIIWCFLIFAFTASPSSSGSHTLSTFQQLFGLDDEQAKVVNFLVRKATHVVVFGFLALLFTFVLRKKRFLFAWTLTTVYAATDEFHQSFVPGRTASIADVLLDSVGAALALFVWSRVVSEKKQDINQSITDDSINRRGKSSE